MNPSSNIEPAIGPLRIAGPQSGSRFYACVITVATVLMFGMLLWPLTVHTFRSTASFEIGYESSSGLDKSALNQLIISAMRDATRPEITVDMLRGLKSEIESPILKSPDAEKIRDVISIKGRPGRNANSIEYQVEFLGAGGPDEIEFLNALVVRINSALDQRVAGGATKMAVSELSDEFSRFHTGTIEQFATQVDEVLTRIKSANNELQTITNDLSNWAPGAASELGSPLGQFDAQGNANGLNRLVGEKNRLLSLSGYTPQHFEVLAIQEQIEALQYGAGSGTANASFQVPAGSNATTIRNQFASTRGNSMANTPANSMRPADTAVAKVVREIASLRLGSTVQELGALSKEIVESGNNADLLTKRMAERVEGKLGSTSPIVVQDFRKARSSLPVGGTPTGKSFMWLAMIAGMIGVMVALNYDPALNVRRFRSLEHLQSCLGIPVIGTIRSRVSARTTQSMTRRIAALAVRAGEWTLLITVVLLFVAAISNSQVASAFLENPFHGITRTVWMMTSHG